MLALIITLGWWIVPLIITIVILGIMFRPVESCGNDFWGFGTAIECLFRLFWMIPLLFVWLVYFIGLAVNK